ncbi:hypothetical protein D3C71_1381400 [compost metagenome]
MIQLQRLADLGNTPGVQHHDLVGQRHRFHLIVRHVNHGALQTLVQTRNLNAHLHPQRGVEVRQRLVEQEHVRFRHQRTADRHPLTLPAGQRFWPPVEQVSQLQHFRHLIDPLADFRFLGTGQLQAERHVVGHRQVRIQRIGLKHHANAALGRRHLIHAFIADHQVARGDVLQPGNHAQQCRFAAARRPDKHHKLTVIYRQIDVFGNHSFAEGLINAAQYDASHALLPCFRS